MSAHPTAPGDDTTTPRPTTMRAIVQDTYGTHEVLRLREIPVPVPQEDEVLIKVSATSLNAADWHFMTGEPYFMRLMFGLRRPGEAVQGRDVAGRVEAVGAAVTALRPGDEVFGRPGASALRGGAFAEYACARADQVIHKPASLTYEQAAAVPLAANTALQGLRDCGEVTSGQRVLINGTSGGVGTFAVQIAKVLGAEVTAVCGTRNEALVRSLGADHVIDYTAQDFTRAGQRYDVVFDLVANHSVAALRRAMTPTGTLVLAGGGGGRWFASVPQRLRASALSPFVRQRLRPLDDGGNTANNLAQLTEWMESGRVTAAIDRVYPLSETPEAMRYLVEDHARAKVVITV